MKLTLTLMLGFCSAFTALAQAPYDQYLISWQGTGYTTAKGHISASVITPAILVKRVAQDNFPDNWQQMIPQLCLVYRAEKRDMAVVYKSNGAFVADVYQTEYTYLDVTNATDTSVVRQAFLADEYHTDQNGNPIPTGSTFGIETKTVNKLGNITSYYYHGNFQYAMYGGPTPLDPEINTVWTGTFSTGARVPYKLPISSAKPVEKRSQFQFAAQPHQRGGERMASRRLAST
ncbi:MAG TPA: hypothetical protein VGN61_10525 [Verrucomicrobiae bacterium]